MRALLLHVWDGVDLTTLLDDEVESFEGSSLAKLYMRVAKVAKSIATSSQFTNFITFIIIIAGIMVGMQTYEQFDKKEKIVLMDGIPVQMVVGDLKSIEIASAAETVILIIFTFEVLVKTVAEGFNPTYYFYKNGVQGWNVFDWIVVVGSFLPGSGSMLNMLRLLRLLRVLKLLRALPELQVIVVALIGGLSSISYIGIILIMIFYVFAILGMIFFQANDPWHFGSIHMSMFTLFRCATLEDWTDVMYINMYGCDNYGYDGMEDLCVAPYDWGWISALFFVLFTFIGALILMTLFIGVVTTSMDEATNAQKEAKDIENRVKLIAEKESIDANTIEMYRTVFGILDLDGGGSIEEEELRFGLRSVGKNPSSKELREMMNAVDDDGSGEIDLAEFIEFMTNLKRQRENDKANQDSSSKPPLHPQASTTSIASTSAESDTSETGDQERMLLENIEEQGSQSSSGHPEEARTSPGMAIRRAKSKSSRVLPM